MKNCGVLIHDEVATKVFMEEMRELVKQTTDDNIKNKVCVMPRTALLWLRQTQRCPAVHCAAPRSCIQWWYIVSLKNNAPFKVTF